MNILIAGAGAVGGYYGACLLRAGLKVSYLLTPESLSVIKKRGLNGSESERLPELVDTHPAFLLKITELLWHYSTILPEK